MLETDIKTSINQLCDKFFNDGITNTITIVEQLSYLFFLKWLEVTDEYESSPFMKARKGLADSAFPYMSSQIDKVRWSNIRQMDNNNLVSHMANEVFPWLKSYDATLQEFSRQMNNAVYLISRPSLLIEAMDVIDASFGDGKPSLGDDQYWQKSAVSYAFLLERLGTEVKSGHLHTPKRLVDLLVGLADPSLLIGVADLACGTGGMLVAANTAHQNMKRGGMLKEPPIPQFTLKGFDSDPFNVRISMLNLMLNGINAPLIEKRGVIDLSSPPQNFPLIVTRVPIGSIQYVAPTPASQLSSRRSELLYIEQIINNLSVNFGRAVLLVPAHILTETLNESIALRSMILRSANLEGVFSIDDSVKKYGADLAIIFFTIHRRYAGTMADPLENWSTQNVWFQRLGDEEVNIAIETFQNWRTYITKEDEDSKFTVGINDIAAKGFDLGINSYRNVSASEPPAPVSPDPVGEMTASDTPTSGEVLVGLFEKLVGNADSLGSPMALQKIIYKLLPLNERDLVDYLKDVHSDDTTALATVKNEELFVNALLNILRFKKGEAVLSRITEARRHPYYQHLRNCCDVQLGPGKPKLNLLDIAQRADLHEFSVFQLTRAIEHDTGSDPRLHEGWVKEQLQQSLLQFIVMAKMGFTFRMLQDVLRQLLFLPDFGILRNFVWDNIGADGSLRQQYISKVANFPTADVIPDFKTFTIVSGHIHLIHSSHVTTNSAPL
jgi:type I restriction enzyme M protein